jgi:glycosyltransferase involved in cell wall biosynthesis
VLKSTICIGLPVYNSAHYLRRALEALLEQKFSDFQIIVLDDGSTDESYTILEDYAQQDQRLRLFSNSQSSGLIAAWNKVAKLAEQECRPEFFAWYSDHDWVSDNWLESQMDVIQEDPSTVLVTTSIQNVDENGAATSSPQQGLSTAKLDAYNALRAVTVDDYGAGNAVYGLFRYANLKRRNFLPEEILPDRLLISGMVLEGVIQEAVGATRYRRNFAWNSNSEDIIQRQLKTLFGPMESPKLAPRFMHASYFIRQFLDERGAPIDPARDSERLIHAYLYLINQFNSDKDNWSDELTDIDTEAAHELQWIAPFGKFIAEEKWLPLASKVQKRFLSYKADNKTLRQTLVANDTERKTLQQALDKLKPKNKALQQALDDHKTKHKTLQQALDEHKTKHKTLQQALDDHKTKNNALRQTLDEHKTENKTLQQALDHRKTKNNALQQNCVTTRLRISSCNRHWVNTRLSR